MGYADVLAASVPIALLTALLGANDLRAQSSSALVERLDGPTSAEAEAALRKRGVEAVDALIDAGALDSEAVRARTLGLLAWLGLRAGDVADRIIEAYPNQPTDPEEFVALLDALGAVLPGSERLRAERVAMGAPGEWSMPASFRALVGRVTCRTPVPDELAPRLRLAQSRLEVRGFFRLGPDSTTEELVAALDDELPLLRELAAQLLAIRGEGAAEAVPALAAALRAEHVRDVPRIGIVDNTAVVRAAAARALIASAAAHSAAAPAYAFVLRHGCGDERLEAVTSLTRLGADAVNAVPSLIASLDDDGARNLAIVALGGIGPAASGALPRLRELARSDDAEVARRSAAAVRSLERD